MSGHSFSIAGGLFRKSDGKIDLWNLENPSYLTKGKILSAASMLNISVCIAPFDVIVKLVSC